MIAFCLRNAGQRQSPFSDYGIRKWHILENIHIWRNYMGNMESSTYRE